MERLIIFIILALFVLGSATLAVLTRRIMRAATFLLFALFGIAGLYFCLGYEFLGTVQLAIYAGGVTILYVFAINVVNKNTLQGIFENFNLKRWLAGATAAVAALAVILLAFFKTKLVESVDVVASDTTMEVIGKTMMGAGKYNYILPFEFISVFLLVCIIGGIVIARKEDDK
ncbi:MAG: NADH-quinone oxidoreductase subunit J [Prevotellaceae bacterium]|nr:NADH-quinone oxidoreductase subunit J [Prevotellaceae bacterium]